jgi:hypothetical protein
VFYLSAQTSMMRAGPNRAYYLKKRAGGHTYAQAIITLARRRIDVLWASSATTAPSTLTRPAALSRLDNIIEIPNARARPDPRPRLDVRRC